MRTELYFERFEGLERHDFLFFGINRDITREAITHTVFERVFQKTNQN